MRIPVFISAGLALLSSVSHAMNCDQVRSKARAPQNKPNVKPGCTLEDHYTGVGNGSTVSIYKCGGATFKLETDQFGKCTVNGKKK